MICLTTASFSHMLKMKNLGLFICNRNAEKVFNCNNCINT